MIAAAACALTFVSCKSEVESKATEYLEKVGDLMQKEDSEGALKVWDEYCAWEESLTDEQKTELNNKLGSQKETLSGMMDLYRSLVGNDTEATEEDAEEAGSLEEAMEGLGEAVEGLTEAGLEEALNEALSE